MRLKLSAIILSSILLLTGSSFGQNIITLDHATGTYGTSSDTLEVGQDVNLFMRWTQNVGNPINGYSLGFKIYSDDGAQWVATDSGAYTGAITGGMIDFSFINTFSLDGMGADTVAFSGFALFGTGIPDPFDEVVWSVSLGTIDASQACKTICIDSSFFPPGGPWQWSVLGAGSFIPDWGGPYCFLIFDPANPCIFVPDPPVLGAIGSQNTTECVPLSVALSATDPQNDQLTFTVEGGPPGAVLTDNGDGTGSFDWTPAKGDGGNYNVLFIVTANSSSLADSEMVSISVAADGSPTFATVAPQTVQECQLLSVGVTATDPEATTMTLTISSGPSGAAITDNGDGTGTVTWTPTAGDAGAAIITVTATDACGSAGTVDINITVAADSPPAFVDPGAQTATECLAFSVTVSATDPESSTPSFAKVSGPAAATVTDNGDGTATIDWTPAPGDAEANTVTVSATDACGTVTSLGVEINVAADGAPTFVAVDPQTAKECQLLSVAVSATDPEATTMTLAILSGPAGVAIVDNGDGTGTVNWTPALGTAGPASIAVTATDECGSVGILNIDVTVDADGAPVLGSIGAQFGRPEQLLSFSFSATDPEATQIDFSAQNLPAAATLTDNGDGSGSFDWTPTVADLGTIDVTIIATDQCGSTTQEIVTITVAENIPPVITQINDYNIDECQIIDDTFTATDVEGDPISLWVEPLILNMTFNDNGDGTGAFHFAPSLSQAGSYPTILYASDGTDTAMAEFTINVANCQPSAEGDTLYIGVDVRVPGSRATIPVNFRNQCDLNAVTGIIGWQSSDLHLDSLNFAGSRVDYLSQKLVTINNGTQQVEFDLTTTGGEPPVAADSGMLFQMHFSISPGTAEGAYAVDPFLVPLNDLNPKFFRDCGFGEEIVAPFIAPGFVAVEILPGYVCGTVVDTNWNVIEGATVELWADYPISGADSSTTTTGLGGFAFDSVTVPPLYDIYAYKEGYYPGSVDDLDFGESGVVIMLTPVPDVPGEGLSTQVAFFSCPLVPYLDGLLPIGSVIDAYDVDNVHCGSWFVTTAGRYDFMPVYGDDPLWPGDEGPLPGEQVTFYVNGKADGFLVGSDTWTQNNANIEFCFEVTSQITDTCYLAPAWNLVSWPLDTPNDDILEILVPINGLVEFVVGYEQGGLAFDPALVEFSTLLSMDHLSGYWIRIDPVTCPDGIEFEITGQRVPETLPIPLNLGANLVSYLPVAALPVADAVASIPTDDLLAVIGYDGVPQIYQPGAGGDNSLIEMVNCKGYWILVDQPATLTYPANGGSAPPASEQQPAQMASDAGTDISRTTAWLNLYSHSLLVDGQQVESGAVVTAHSLDGITIGEATVRANGRFGFMSVYAYDFFTRYFSGIKSGDSYYLAIDGRPTTEVFVWTANGDRIEISALTYKDEQNTSLPTSYALRQNYPNPFNPSTSIEFDMPNAGKARLEVYNLLGELVAVPFDGIAEAGRNKVVWDGRDRYGNTASSGVYFYRLSADNYFDTRKMILLK